MSKAEVRTSIGSYVRELSYSSALIQALQENWKKESPGCQLCKMCSDWLFICQRPCCYLKLLEHANLGTANRCPLKSLRNSGKHQHLIWCSFWKTETFSQSLSSA